MEESSSCRRRSLLTLINQSINQAFVRWLAGWPDNNRNNTNQEQQQQQWRLIEFWRLGWVAGHCRLQ